MIFILQPSRMKNWLLNDLQKMDQRQAGLATPISVRSAWPTAEPVTMVDPFDPDNFLIGLRYTRKNKDLMNQAYAFNFSTKKVSG